MTWICKKCGQIQSDSIIYGDGLCDDCFEKLHEKKNKKRGFFYRFVSLALVLSLVLCLLTGYASAEDSNYTSANTSTVGSYLGYDMIKFDSNQLISYQFFVDQLYKYNSIDSSINYVYFVLLDFDASGVPSIYSAGSSRRFATINFEGGNSSKPYSISFNGTMSFSQDIVTPKDTSYYYTSLNFFFDDNNYYYTYKQSNKTYPEVYYYPIDYTNGVRGFNGFSGTGNTYLAIVPYASSNNNISSVLGSLQTGSLSDLNIQSSPVANFYTCKSAPFTDTSHGLYVKSWLKDGEQYPYFGWWINDNGNNHKYKVVFSYNDTQKELFETFYKSTKSNPLFSDGWWVEKAFPILSVSKESMIVANEIATQTGFADFMANKTWWMWHYNTLFTLNHNSMDFTSQTGNKIYSINLSDYSSVYEYLFYRAQIVDVTTGNILDTVYFTSQESYNKSDSGYGSKVYDYGDNSQGMIDDLKNNTSSVEPDNFGTFISDGDVIDTPIIDENGNTIWDNINIGGMYSPLNFGLSAVSDFFQNLWLIYPDEIRSIIISGLSLIVILRVLGR